MLGSHCRFSSIDSEYHRQNEECRQVQTKTLRANKVDNSFVDEVATCSNPRRLLSIDRYNFIFVSRFPNFSISKHR